MITRAHKRDEALFSGLPLRVLLLVYFIERTTTAGVHLYASVQAIDDETKRERVSDSIFKDVRTPLYRYKHTRKVLLCFPTLTLPPCLLIKTSRSRLKRHNN